MSPEFDNAPDKELIFSPNLDRRVAAHPHVQRILEEIEKIKAYYGSYIDNSPSHTDPQGASFDTEGRLPSDFEGELAGMYALLDRAVITAAEELGISQPYSVPTE